MIIETTPIEITTIITIFIISIMIYKKYSNKIKFEQDRKRKKEKWEFARKVLLEIKKQKKNPLITYPNEDGIPFNVWCLLRKDDKLNIENFGRY